MRIQAHTIGALFCLVLVVGCSAGGRDEETATVEGKVTYKGDPVPEGSQLLFVNSSKGITMAFEVGADGSYSVPSTAKLPSGPYSVAIGPKGEDDTGDDYESTMMGSPDAAPKKDTFPVPEKFRSASTSEKEVELTVGSQTVDIDFGG